MKTNGRRSAATFKSRAVTAPRSKRVRQPAVPGARPPLKIKSILVPIDFSATSRKALAYAETFADRFGAKLVLLHVVESVAVPDFARAFPMIMENDRMLADARREMDRFARQLGIDPAIVERTLVRAGRSFHEIATAARTLKADLIIIGTHGRTGLKHAFLGSTAEGVVRYAPCPVLVVRRHERDF